MFYRISSQPGCGYSFEGAAVAAEMYYKQEIRAFIGPYCSSGSILSFHLKFIIYAPTIN